MLSAQQPRPNARGACRKTARLAGLQALVVIPSCSTRPASIMAATAVGSSVASSIAPTTLESSPLPTRPSAEVLQVLRSAQAFCFDVDSTFCEDESIDELAAYLGMGEAVAALTAQAMGGSVEFRQALSARLGVMRPSKASVEQFLRDHPHRITNGIPQLLQRLKARGQQVFLVSGGFRQIIHPLALSLDIPLSNVFANTILFDAQGNYCGFDENEFTSRSGGKPAAVQHIKAKFGVDNVVMVGDGATDLEARTEGAASLFIGFGGVVTRPNIADKADWFVTSFDPVIAALDN